MTTVSSISSATSYTTTSSTSTSTSTTEAEDSLSMYLQLLITQLQYQDPLDPVETSDLTDQLTQQSQLSAQLETNELLEDLVESYASSNSTTYALSYLGTDVLVESTDATVASDGTAEWQYSIEDDADTVTLTVYNADGTALYTAEGSAEAGTYSFTFDEQDLAEAGETLYLDVSAASEDGDSITTTTYSYHTVDAVDMTGDEIVLQSGDQSFSITSVLAAKTA